MKIDALTAAKLQMTMVYMGQENAFGLKIEFPESVKHLADKTMADLTEEEAQQLIAAGMDAHAKALGYGKYDPSNVVAATDPEPQLMAQKKPN